MIIRFYDNEDYDYPLIDIWEEDLHRLKEILKKYQKEEDYNFDEFLKLLNKNGVQYNMINEEIDLFF